MTDWSHSLYQLELFNRPTPVVHFTN